MSADSGDFEIKFSALDVTIVFVALKLTGTIHWHWAWVLSPFWIPWTVAIAVGLLIGLADAISAR